MLLLMSQPQHHLSGPGLLTTVVRQQGMLQILSHASFQPLVVYAIGWAAVYVVFRCIFSGFTPDFSNRLVSTAHAAASLACAAATISLRHPFSHIGQPNTIAEVSLSFVTRIFMPLCCE